MNDRPTTEEICRNIALDKAIEVFKGGDADTVISAALKFESYLEGGYRPTTTPDAAPESELVPVLPRPKKHTLGRGPSHCFKCQWEDLEKRIKAAGNE